MVPAPAGATSPIGTTQVFAGERFGIEYALAAAVRTNRPDCVDLFLLSFSDDPSPVGCASPHGGLSGYGIACANGAKFLWGLVPDRVTAINGTLGAATVTAQLKALPASWRTSSRAWLLSVGRGSALRTLTALAGGRVVDQDRLEAPLCPLTLGRVRSRTIGGISWSYRLALARGAGPTTNLCATAEFRQSGEDSCLPLGSLKRSLLFGETDIPGCSPRPYTLLGGLVEPAVRRVVVSAGHTTVAAHLIRLPRRGFNAFVVTLDGVPARVSYLLYLRSGVRRRTVTAIRISCQSP